MQGVLLKPISEWKRPTTFPSLITAKVIAVDVETRDPNLKQLGPGAVRGDGELAGIAIAVDGWSGYYPVAHLDTSDNFKIATVQAWLNVELGRVSQPKVGHNIIYDLEFLQAQGIRVRGPLYDTQHLEALIDEENPDGYSLNALAKRYLGLEKDEALLKEAASAYGVDPKSELWKLDPIYVGAYAEADTTLCLAILKKQLSLIREQELDAIMDLEMRMIPVLLAMRFKGVRLDTEKALKLSISFEQKQAMAEKQMKALCGLNINPWSAQQIAVAFDKLGLPYEKTTKNNPSFTDEFLKSQSNPFVKLLREVRGLSKLRGMFVDDLLGKFCVNGRIHAQFHQMKGDENGTRTGRMASSNPNLQQIPKRNEELAPLIRALFVPDPGCQWGKFDYAQQEPRLMVHYSYICGLSRAEDFVAAYRDNPDMDFYEPIIRATGARRIDAKGMALGRCYGMGTKKMAEMLGTDVDHAAVLLKDFDAAAPFLRQLADVCASRANSRGWIKTVLGRKRHFNLWEPINNYSASKQLPLEQAREKWGSAIRRVGTHKALNSLIQGSAADMMKKAMVDLYEKENVVPHLTVHDEIGESIGDEDYAYMIKEYLEKAISLCIPVKCDMSLGDSWQP